MKKINNKLILFSLILLAFVAFNGTPKTANAYYYVGFVNGNYIGCETDLDNNGAFVGCGHVNNTVYNKTNVANSTTTVSSSKTNTTSKNVTASKNVKSTTAEKTNDTSSSNKNVDASKDGGNGLAANALFGSNGFMPTNIFQWFLLFILILLVVMISRKMFKENKVEQPLKHA